jgi:hypothetical protein
MGKITYGKLERQKAIVVLPQLVTVDPGLSMVIDTLKPENQPPIPPVHWEIHSSSEPAFALVGIKVRVARLKIARHAYLSPEPAIMFRLKIADLFAFTRGIRLESPEPT